VNEDGEFVCEDHKPAPKLKQWVVSVEVDQDCRCDHCDKQAAYYVLEQ
jgi:hypothetical protein